LIRRSKVPEERRAIWLSHLGAGTAISPNELNQLAALVDFTGGHIRNVVLTAAAEAKTEDRDIRLLDLVLATKGELRKLGKQLPVDLVVRINGHSRGS